MARLSHRLVLWIPVCVVIGLSGVRRDLVSAQDQPDVPPSTRATSSLPADAPDDIGKLTKAIEGLTTELSRVGQRVEGLEGVVGGQNNLINDLQRDVQALKKNPSISGSTRAAVIDTPPAPTNLDGTARELPEPPTVPGTFWTVEASQRLGIYRFEPRIKEATQMISELFGLAANEAAAATTPEELEVVPGKFRQLFIEKLEASGRTELTVHTWGNAVDAWLSHINEKLKTAADFEAYRTFLVEALRDGQKNAVAWGVAIDKAHDDARGGAIEAAASGMTAAGSGSAGGYLPPLAAFHNARHLRKVNRLKGRIYMYGRR
ncbi:MAG: hypothetical protein WD872_07610 [Pirellulaceae bacterium]